MALRRRIAVRPRPGEPSSRDLQRRLAALTWYKRGVPRSPLPPELGEFLSEPNPAVIATLHSDGRPHTVATWYLWEGGHVLVNMDERRDD